MNDGLALGVDLGGTKIAFALVDAEGRVARFVDFFDTLGEAAAMGVIRAAN